MTDVKHILDKVRKLRNLAAGASTLAEAEAAAAQAEAIIARYRLDEAQIGLDGAAVPTDVEAAEEPLYSSGRPNGELWRESFANLLAEHYGCAVYSTRDSNGHSVIRIVGRDSDVTIVRYMFAWLTTEIERLSLSEWGRSARHSFRMGAVVGLADTLEATQKKVTPLSQMRAALALVDQKNQAAEFLRRSVKLRPKSAKYRGGDAYERGKKAGAKIHLGAGLGSGTPTKRIG